MMAIFLIFMLSYKEGSLIPESHEINELEFVRTVALDHGTDNNMRVTILMRKEKQTSGAAGGEGSGGGGEEGGEAEIITGEGNTAFSTQRFFQSYADKFLFYGHADYILIGEAAAGEDLRKYLDFVTRDHEYRLTAHVYIAQGKAEDILTSSKAFLPDKLRSLYKSVEDLSTSNEIAIYDLVSKLEDNRTFAVTVPIVKLLETESLQKMENKKQQSGQGGQSGTGAGSGQGPGAEVQKTKEIALGGFAVIKNFKLIGFLDDYQARACLFVTNKISSASIEVPDQTGSYVGLELLESKTQIVPVIKDARLTGVTVKTMFQTNVDEIHGVENIFKEDRLKYIESEQSNQIKKQIEDLVRYAQDNKADFIGIGQAVSMAHPLIWKECESNWPEIFSSLDISVQVESKVDRSYNITEPIGNTEH